MATYTTSDHKRGYRLWCETVNARAFATEDQRLNRWETMSPAGRYFWINKAKPAPLVRYHILDRNGEGWTYTGITPAASLEEAKRKAHPLVGYKIKKVTTIEEDVYVHNG